MHDFPVLCTVSKGSYSKHTLDTTDTSKPVRFQNPALLSREQCPPGRREGV